MKKILIVDDDLDMLASVGTVLRLSGYDVFTLQDAAHVTQQIRAVQPDLVLLDIRLSGLDGRTICYVLKSNAQYHPLPIIIMSGEDVPREEILACGADEFLRKPFTLTTLMGHMETLLNIPTLAP